MLRFAIQTIRYVTKNSIENGYKLTGPELKSAFDEMVLVDQKERRKAEIKAKKKVSILMSHIRTLMFGSM